MRSKTSCFNVTIFRKNFTHFWPIWLIYLSYLTLILPVNIWLDATNKGFYENVPHLTRQSYIMYDTLSIAIAPQPVFLFAAAITVAVFSYLYTAKNANMIHSLPVNRFELFFTNYLSGLLFMIIPEIIVFVASVLVCLANEITSIQHLFVWLLYISGVTFFAVTMAVFVAMFTGQAFVMPIYYLILNYLYVGSLYIINLIMGLISYGISNSWNPGSSCVLSPLYYLGNNMRVRTIDGIDQIAGITFTGGKLVAGYAAVAVLLLAAAYWLYKNRKIETAGDFISIALLKPVFRWGVALMGGVLSSLFVTSILMSAHSINIFASILVSIIVFGFICFFVAEMLLQKNFRVFRKKRILEWLGFTVVAVLFISLFKLDVFGIERRIPSQDEIEAAFVYMDYPIQVGEAQLSELLEIHHKVIEEKEEYLKISKENEGYYYTTFRYYLKDGSVFERRYALPVTDEYVEDTGSPTARILEWERDPEKLKEQILGRNYKINNYYSGYIDLYTEDGKSDTYVFNRDELDELIQAIILDIDAGDFQQYHIYSLNQKDWNTYYNGISISYQSKGMGYDNWDYYASYNQYRNRIRDREVDGNVGTYISFGPECVNVVNTLERLGIVNDIWHLYMGEEYDEIMNQ